MDELLKQLAAGSAEGAAGFTFAEFLLSLGLSFALGLAVTLVYRATHSGTSYSRSFAVTMVIMSVTVSFIMLIIGSNLARAFSLVGALSIIRYRNAVRESRDTAFIFLAMAVGMACGVRLYGQAVVFTAAAAAMLWLLEATRFGAARAEERLLRLALAEGASTAEVDAAVQELCGGRCALLSSEALGAERVLLYSVELPRERASADAVSGLSRRLGGVQVQLLTGFDRFNL